MRLGGSVPRAETVAELDDVAVTADTYGLSAILAPAGIVDMSDDEAAAFGERARALGFVVGESWFDPNIMTRDLETRAHRVQSLRAMAQKADIMGCRSVCLPVGSVDASDHPLAPHPYMFTDECRAEFRELVLRILDGLDLKRTRLLVEPWNTSFFYRPDAILDFLHSVDHPSFALHLDQMNMVDQQHYFCTDKLINETFDLLAPYIGSVHLKDIRWDPTHKFLKFDEVMIGEGVLDYRVYLRRLFALERDMTTFCEHLQNEGEYAVNFARLHYMAAELGGGFVRRQPASLVGRPS